VDDCFIKLTPASWMQSINAHARKLALNCESLDADHLQVDVDFAIDSFCVQLSLLDSEPVLSNGRRLEHGIGVFAWCEEYFGGWLALRPESFNELWEQVRTGGYSDCQVTLTIGPVEADHGGSLWRVSENKALYILGYEIDFTRRTPKPNRRAQQRAGLIPWLRPRLPAK
jgi:hypothetical protein